MIVPSGKKGPARPKGWLLALLPALALSVAGCSSSQTEADEVYRSGVAKSQGDTQGAIKIFEDGLSAYPNHHRMRFALARLYYDTGETEHLEERRAHLEGKKRQEEGKQADAQALEREAQDHRAKATPFYKNCRDHLKIVGTKDDDIVRRAWAYVILMKCDVFFDDWNQAADDLDRAIDLGTNHLPPQKLNEWKDYLRQLQQETSTKKPRS
ncbi:tetratricopeptide repeat protein [bacterium]|nr:tetratricopeptide repeat protein [bacterium]